MKKPLRNFARVAAVFAVLSLIPIIWSFWPGSQTHEEIVFQNRQFVIDRPERLAAANSGEVILAIKRVPTGQVSQTPGAAGGMPAALDDLYLTHQVMAEARLEISGVEVKPSGPVSEPLLRDQDLRFSWQTTPGMPGDYEGTLWLHLVLVPLGGGETERVALMAKKISFHAGDFLGWDAALARGYGLSGFSAGLVGWAMLAIMARKVTVPRRRSR